MTTEEGGKIFYIENFASLLSNLAEAYKDRNHLLVAKLAAKLSGKFLALAVEAMTSFNLENNLNEYRKD